MTHPAAAGNSPTQAVLPTSTGTDGPAVARVLPTEPPGLVNVLGMAAPLAVFLLANAAWGLVPGMLASTAVAIVVIWVRRRRGRGTGWLGLALLGYLLLRGAAGALTGSHEVYFGLSVAASIAAAAAVLATAFTRTPVAAYVLPLLMRGRLRPETAAHSTYRRVSAHVTAVWAVAELTVSGWEAWHLSHADAVEFVAARGLIGWPAMMTVIFACAFYARFRIEWMQGPSPRTHWDDAPDNRDGHAG